MTNFEPIPADLLEKMKALDEQACFARMQMDLLMSGFAAARGWDTAVHFNLNSGNIEITVADPVVEEESAE